MEDQFVVVDDEVDTQHGKPTANSLTNYVDHSDYCSENTIQQQKRSVTHVISIENGCIHYLMGSEEANIRPLSEREMMDACGADPLGTQCLICGGTANGIHFGALSCAACNAFFRRSVSENRKYVCRRDGNCVTNCAVRCFCRACRLKKCIAYGMDPKAVQPHRDLIGRKRLRSNTATDNRNIAPIHVASMDKQPKRPSSTIIAEGSQLWGSGLADETNAAPNILPNTLYDDGHATRLMRENGVKKQMKVAQMLNSPNSLAEQLIAFSQKPVEIINENMGEKIITTTSAALPPNVYQQHPAPEPNQTATNTYCYTVLSPIVTSNEQTVTKCLLVNTMPSYATYKEATSDDLTDYLPNNSALTKNGELFSKSLPHDEANLRNSCYEPHEIGDRPHYVIQTSCANSNSEPFNNGRSPIGMHEEALAIPRPIALDPMQGVDQSPGRSSKESQNQFHQMQLAQTEYQQVHQLVDYNIYDQNLATTSTSQTISTNSDSTNSIIKTTNSQGDSQQRYVVYEYDTVEGSLSSVFNENENRSPMLNYNSACIGSGDSEDAKQLHMEIASEEIVDENAQCVVDAEEANCSTQQNQQYYCEKCTQRSAETRNIVDATLECYKILRERRRLLYCRHSLRDLFSQVEPRWYEFRHDHASSQPTERLAALSAQLVEFIQSIPGFSSIDVEDKLIIARKFTLPFVLLERYFITFCMNGLKEMRIYRQDYTYIQLQQSPLPNRTTETSSKKDTLTNTGQQAKFQEIMQNANFPTSTTADDEAKIYISTESGPDTDTAKNSSDDETNQLDPSNINRQRCTSSSITEINEAQFYKALKDIVEPMSILKMEDFEFIGLTLVLLFDSNDDGLTNVTRESLKKLRDQLYRDWFDLYESRNLGQGAERIGNCILIISSIKESVRLAAENFHMLRVFGLSECDKMLDEFLL